MRPQVAAAIDALITRKQDTADAILTGGAGKFLTEMNNTELIDCRDISLPPDASPWRYAKSLPGGMKLRLEKFGLAGMLGVEINAL